MQADIAAACGSQKSDSSVVIAVLIIGMVLRLGAVALVDNWIATPDVSAVLGRR